MLFLVYTRDREGALETRLANREAHVRWLSAAGDQVRAAGPWLGADGAMAGSLLLVEAESREALDDWLAGDPYVQAGLFERVEIAPYRWTINPPPGLGT